MAYNPGTNIVVSGKTFMDVPSVQLKHPTGLRLILLMWADR